MRLRRRVAPAVAARFAGNVCTVRGNPHLHGAVTVFLILRGNYVNGYGCLLYTSPSPRD